MRYAPFRWIAVGTATVTGHGRCRREETERNRLFGAGGSFTGDRRGRFIAPRASATARCDERAFQLRLNTGACAINGTP